MVIAFVHVCLPGGEEEEEDLEDVITVNPVDMVEGVVAMEEGEVATEEGDITMAVAPLATVTGGATEQRVPVFL